MNYELISAEEYAALPDDDELCFVEFEAICRRNMTRMINEDTSGGFNRVVQAQYMTAVAAAGAVCGIPNVELAVYDENQFHDFYSRFSLTVQGEVTRIRLRGRRGVNLFSVQLAPNTRTKIEHHMTLLRRAIENSDLAAAKKEAMIGKVDQLFIELQNRRLGFGPVMAILSAVLVGMASATTIAAEGPAAVTHIMKLISLDKASEDAAAARLAPPPKALPAPPAKPAAPSRDVPDWALSPAGLDDDIPF